MRLNRSHGSLGAAIGLGLIVGTFSHSSGAPCEDPEAFRRNPMGLYLEQRDDEAILCGRFMLEDGKLTGDERARVLAMLGTIFAKNGHEEEARVAFGEILREDPQRAFPIDTLPERPKRIYFAVQDSLLAVTARLPDPDPRTLAIGDIEVNVMEPGRYDMDAFGAGLVHELMNDLRGATSLRLVERRRIATLEEEEARLRAATSADESECLRRSRRMGAQSFLFGELLQTERNRIKMDFRWVDTSTSEILLSESVEGRFRRSEDLFDLEDRILKDVIIPLIRRRIGDDDTSDEVTRAVETRFRAKAESDSRSYLARVLATGDAILAGRRGDLDGAARAWAEVAALSLESQEATERSRALLAYTGE